MFYTQKFNTMMEFYNFIVTAPNNTTFRNENDSETNSEDFTGTRDFKQAADLFLNGWDSGISAIKGCGNDFSAPANKAIVRNYYVGGSPNVARAMQGLPDSMRQVYRVPQKQKVLTLFIDMCVSARIKRKRYMECGCYLYQAVREIERQGTRVQIITGFADRIDGKPELIICPEIVLKRASENVDAGRLSFALAHMGMFRRLGFKYIETCPAPNLNNEKAVNYSTWGYGNVAISDEKVKAKFEQKVKKDYKYAACVYMQELCNNSDLNSGEKMVETIKGAAK